ncbi:MAG: hypothetical protein FWB90_08555 [Fibromonadales bacterium]|nr:hypothetical protein [Fibromonadales bacterium]
MKHLCVFATVFALLFVACGTHEVNNEKIDGPQGPYSANEQQNPSSSSEQPSSSSEQPSSSSELSSSSEVPESSSSSETEVIVKNCPVSGSVPVNGECIYAKTITITEDDIEILFDSQTNITFADGASLVIDSYSNLIIEEGAQLKFGENSRLEVRFGDLKISGKLEALDADKLWAGVKINSNAGTISIEGADISGANIGIDFGKNGILKNSKIHDNNYGIKQNIAFANGNFSGNEFYSNNYDADIRLDAAITLGSSEQFKGKIYVSGSQSFTKGIILPNFVYHIDNTIIQADTLTINAGAHFYFTENSGISIRNYIKAIGTADEPIIFEPTDPEIFWGGASPNNNAAFHFAPYGGDERNEFEYFEILRPKVAFFNQSQLNLKLSNGKIEDYRFDNFKSDGANMTGKLVLDPENPVVITPYTAP